MSLYQFAPLRHSVLGYVFDSNLALAEKQTALKTYKTKHFYSLKVDY